MYAWWAYDEVRQRQERAARAAERRAAQRAGDGAEVTASAWRRRTRRGGASESLALRLPGGALFLIPGSVVRDWKAA
jgi:hypothetical protein